MNNDEFNKNKACLIIKHYLEQNNLPSNFTLDEIYSQYTIAAEQLIRNSVKLERLRDSVGVKSQTQGDRSTTFNDSVEAWTITDDIKALLPTPNSFYAW